MVVQVGDSIPSVELHQKTPLDDKVDLSKEITGDAYLVFVPAAFSPTCSQGHIPKYITAAKEKKAAAPIYVIAVNDAFTVDAWNQTLDPGKTSGVTFLGDPKGDFTKEFGLLFDASQFFGNWRANRGAVVIKNGKIEKIAKENDPLREIDVSSADRIL